MRLPLNLLYSERLLLDIFSRGFNILLLNQVALVHILRLPQTDRQLLRGLLSNHFLHADPDRLRLVRAPIVILLYSVNSYVFFKVFLQIVT